MELLVVVIVPELHASISETALARGVKRSSSGELLYQCVLYRERKTGVWKIVRPPQQGNGGDRWPNHVGRVAVRRHNAGLPEVSIFHSVQEKPKTYYRHICKGAAVMRFNKLKR